MTWVWPYKTFAEMTAAGYVFRNASKCSGKDCGREIYWFKSPRGYFMCVNVDTLEPHWSVCPNAEDFKRRKKEVKDQEELVPKRPTQDNLF